MFIYVGIFHRKFSIINHLEDFIAVITSQKIRHIAMTAAVTTIVYFKNGTSDHQ